MPPRLSSTAQGAIILSAFFIPVLTYLYYTQKSKTTTPSAGPLPPPTEITALYIHPIKSCHGISVQSAKLLPTGLDLDRQWMWVSHPSNEFLTIRQNPKMTLIRPSYDSSSDTLTITAPSPTPSSTIQLTIPAHPSAEWLAQNTTTAPVNIWSQAVPAHIYSPSLTSAFAAFFGADVRLAYKPPFSSTPRALRSNGAKEHLGRDASTCFPDLMPLLLASEASLAELNARLARAGRQRNDPGEKRQGQDEGDEQSELSVTRFRPNILVRGHAAMPWDEDRWKTVSIAPRGKHGGEPVTLDVTQRYARCRVPNVDPETGVEGDKEPWETLVRYRRVDEGIRWKPCFGMLCVPREGEEETARKVKVGDGVRVLGVGGHKYIPGF